jgi:YD repeat-containing protein
MGYTTFFQHWDLHPGSNFVLEMHKAAARRFLMRSPQSTLLRTATLDTSQTYDGQGRVQTVTYPDGKAYTYAYDTVSRPISLTDNQPTPVIWVNNVQYGLSGELLQISYAGYTETRTYNSRLQLTAVGSMEYRYSPTQNNGQITQQKDWSSGEEVTYAYDSLQRLISAVTTDPSWGQSFTYDGFGNLTSQTQTKGRAPYGNWYYDPLTNRGGGNFDANGNMISVGAFDVENRLVSIPQTNPDGTNGAETYGYATDNKRVYNRTVDGTEEFYFYGISGQKLGTYRPYVYQYGVSISTVDTSFRPTTLPAGIRRLPELGLHACSTSESRQGAWSPRVRGAFWNRGEQRWKLESR